MRKPLFTATIAVICLLAQLAVLALPGAAQAQPERPTLTPTSPPEPTRRPERDPTETPVPPPTEQPTAMAAPTETPAPTAEPPTAVPAPAQLPATGDGLGDWGAALALLALAVLGAGALMRPRWR
jgi:hypothetical protein